MSKWEMVRLGDVCEFINGDRGKNYPSAKDFIDDGIPFVNAGHLANNKVSFESMNYISIDRYNKLGSGKLKFGDVLYCLRGSLGKKAIVNFENGAIASSLVILRTDNKVLLNNYLSYCLDSKLIYEKQVKFNNGSSQPNLSASSVKQYLIPLPPLETQKQISKTLDTASELINLRKKQLEKLDNLIKSVFYEMFGDPILNTKNWGEKIFTDILVLQRGFDLPVQERNQDGDIDVYGSNGILGKHSDYKVENGGIITGRSGTIGKVYYTFDNYWPLNTTLFSKEYYNNNIVYLAYLVEFFNLKRFYTGTGVPTLNRNIVHKEKIIDVPLNLQNKFAQIVSKIEEQKALVQKAIDESQYLFDSLMSKYFD